MAAAVQVGQVWRRKASPSWLIKVTAVKDGWATIEFSCGGYDETLAENIPSYYDLTPEPFRVTLVGAEAPRLFKCVGCGEYTPYLHRCPECVAPERFGGEVPAGVDW